MSKTSDKTALINSRNGFQKHFSEGITKESALSFYQAIPTTQTTNRNVNHSHEHTDLIFASRDKIFNSIILEIIQNLTLEQRISLIFRKQRLKGSLFINALKYNMDLTNIIFNNIFVEICQNKEAAEMLKNCLQSGKNYLVPSQLKAGELKSLFPILAFTKQLDKILINIFKNSNNPLYRDTVCEGVFTYLMDSCGYQNNIYIQYTNSTLLYSIIKVTPVNQLESLLCIIPAYYYKQIRFQSKLDGCKSISTEVAATIQRVQESKFKANSCNTNIANDFSNNCTPPAIVRFTNFPATIDITEYFRDKTPQLSIKPSENKNDSLILESGFKHSKNSSFRSTLNIKLGVKRPFEELLTAIDIEAQKRSHFDPILNAIDQQPCKKPRI
ncbi:MAG: hypothetical protein J0G32_03205 [Alphaproteobacteria bacterium]|nr:hypothetical protein [Alphaproteobacteria bacterium]OJV12090.1 MAG: hypothetical protein BGO27_05050 [Alphaproteobacteria bacterium 33-17]